MFAFPSPIWFALVRMAAIFFMFLAMYPPMMATLFEVEEDVHMASQRLLWAPQNLVGVWLHHSPMLALVHHHSNLAALEFFQMVAHNFCCALPSWVVGEPSPIILPLLFFLRGHKKSFL
jgi:hypothetical protein